MTSICFKVNVWPSSPAGGPRGPPPRRGPRAGGGTRGRWRPGSRPDPPGPPHGGQGKNCFRPSLKKTTTRVPVPTPHTPPSLSPFPLVEPPPSPGGGQATGGHRGEEEGDGGGAVHHLHPLHLTVLRTQPLGCGPAGRGGGAGAEESRYSSRSMYMHQKTTFFGGETDH